MAVKRPPCMNSVPAVECQHFNPSLQVAVQVAERNRTRTLAPRCFSATRRSSSTSRIYRKLDINSRAEFDRAPHGRCGPGVDEIAARLAGNEAREPVAWCVGSAAPGAVVDRPAAARHRR
jgi:hypothetical protein